MPATRVQATSAKSAAGSNAPSATFAGTPAAGNLLFAYVAWNEDAAGTVTISGVSAGWTLVPGNGEVDDSGDVHHAVYYKYAAAGEPTTFAATLSSARRWGVVLAEYAGAGIALDVSAQAIGTATATSSGTTPVTAAGGELAVAFVTAKNIATQTAPTNGFGAVVIDATNAVPASVDVCFAMLEKLDTPKGATSTGTTISTSRAWIGSIVTVRLPPVVTVALNADRLGVKITSPIPAGTTAVDVYRIATASGSKAFVRGWENTPYTGTSLTVYDWEVPLGVEVTYYVQSYTGAAAGNLDSSRPITVTDDHDWLVDLARPTNSFPVYVEGLPDLAYAGVVGVHRVLDRRDPVLTSAPAYTPTGTLTLITTSEAERDRARAILGSGDPFLLRTPPDRGVGNLYLGVTGFNEQRLSRVAQYWERRFVVQVVQVARPDPDVFNPQTPVNYQSRLATWPTYKNATDTGLSYGDLAYQFTAGAVDPDIPWPPDDV